MNNILDIKKIQAICEQIDNNTEEIFNYLMKLSKLIDGIPTIFQDSEVVKICDLLQTEIIPNCKQNNDKIEFIQTALDKSINAYSELDNYYYEKRMDTWE